MNSASLSRPLDAGVDFIALGGSFLANPDLVDRLRTGAPLNQVRDRHLMYVGGETGYTDYPTLAEVLPPPETVALESAHRPPTARTPRSPRNLPVLTPCSPLARARSPGVLFDRFRGARCRGPSYGGRQGQDAATVPMSPIVPDDLTDLMAGGHS